MVERSREIGLVYELSPSTAFTAADASAVDPASVEGLKMIAARIDEAWSWQAMGLPGDDWLRAEELLDGVSHAKFEPDGDAEK